MAADGSIKIDTRIDTGAFELQKICQKCPSCKSKEKT